MSLKKKDQFQVELDNALQKRREHGLSTGFTSTEDDDDDTEDEYESDFEEEVPTPKTKFPPGKTRTKSPVATKRTDKFDWMNDSEDDDVLGGGGSMFLKGSSQPTKRNEVFDPLGTTLRGSNQLRRQIGGDLNEEDDPLLALLKSSKEKTATTGSSEKPQRSKSPEGFPSPHHRGYGSGASFEKSDSRQQPDRPKSPWEKKQSPRDDFAAAHASPRSQGQNLPRMKSPVERRPMSPIAGQTKEHPRSHARRTLSPKSEKQPSALDTILSSVTGTEPAPKARSGQEKLKATDAVKTQSIVDFLLDDSPKPVPRKRRTRNTSQDTYSQQDSLSRPSSAGSKKEKPDRVRSPTGEKSKTRGSSRSPSPGTGLHPPVGKAPAPIPTSSTMGPSLSTFPLTTHEQMSGTFPGLTQQPRSRGARAGKKQPDADADDLLAMFDRALTTEGPVSAPAPVQKETAPVNTAAEKVTEKTLAHTKEHPRQTQSHQLFDDVIDSVAEHNDNLHEKPRSDAKNSQADEGHRTTTPRPKSGKKSYRTPPSNYGGLGSLAALKDLKKKGSETPSEDSLTGAGDLRKAAYMEWLAKREKETKKKKLEEQARKKEEEEKKEKELQDKATENLIVRKKWEEVKADEEKDKIRVKKAQERHKQKEAEEKERQKEKNEKMAERRREEMRKAAQAKKQEDMKVVRKEQREKKRKEQKRKEENEKALDGWMEKRSKQWEKDRKKEQKEKQKRNKEEKYEKEEAAKEAEDRYNTWREQKDNQLKATMREKKMKERRSRYEDDEDVENMLPPWSPPNKVIPRRR